MAEGKKVRLEYDRKRRDAEGRLLAYAYLMDGTFLNAEIVRSGYARTWTASPFRFLEQFQAYEKEARELKRGLWADRRGAQEKELMREVWVGSRDSKVYHYPYCAIAQKIGAPDQRLFSTLKGAPSAGYAPCTVCGPP
jgi:micrococcal nuclease